MAKQAARRKPRTKHDEAWPETAESAEQPTTAVRRIGTADETGLTSLGVARARKRNARRPAVDAGQIAAGSMAEALTSGFRKAVEAAIRDAHGEGLAIPARVDGIAVEIRPGGEVAPIDDTAPWSPADWRKAAPR